MTNNDLWTEENILLGKLLLAVEEMQTFVHNNWTSAQARHKSMPSSGMHFCRAQIRHSSMLAVHARPLPENDEDVDVNIMTRRKRLAESWKLMKSVDRDLWIDVCQLYSMIVAVDKDPEMTKEDIVGEAVEAKVLMRNAEILDAVKTIESFRQEEWSNEQASTAIRHGSVLTFHKQHHEESIIEVKVRHAEHENAWAIMQSCKKAEWASACLYHEEAIKAFAAKQEMLDEAVGVIQDFDSKKWTSAHLSVDEDPCWKASQIRHGSTLAVHENPTSDANDPVYQAHREKMIDAWKLMKKVSCKEWTEACKAHEDIVISTKTAVPIKAGGSCPFSVGVIRKLPPVKNSVNGMAA